MKIPREIEEILDKTVNFLPKTYYCKDMNFQKEDLAKRMCKEVNCNAVVVMPTYNTYTIKKPGFWTDEVGNVIEDLLKIRKNFLGNSLKKIIVVNDGSTDKTNEVLEDLLERDKPKKSILRRVDLNELNKGSLQVINLPTHLGFNYAVITGYEKALEHNPDIIVKMDSDGETPPIFITELLDNTVKLDATHIHYGSPFAKGISSGFFGFRATKAKVIKQLLPFFKTLFIYPGYEAYASNVDDKLTSILCNTTSPYRLTQEGREMKIYKICELDGGVFRVG
jgi:glycosyltransferase involved in cell wall biosynthesis